MNIPSKLQKMAVNRWGADGQSWIDSLPELVEGCENVYGISVLEPFPEVYANYVAPATRADGEEVVFKIGHPKGEVPGECQTLLAFEGEGAVRVLDHDEQTCSMLLEKIDPGYTLETVKDDDESTRIMANLMKNLAHDIPENHNIATVLDWCQKIHEYPSDRISEELRDRAMRIAKNLDATKSANKLLHGDFHHQNILFDEKGGWVAIDPQGVIADPVFEVGVSFYNGPELEKTQDKKTLFLKRAKIFSEILGCDISRVLGWGFVQCMISTAWSVEDGADDYGDVVEGAKVLATLCD